MIVVTGANSMFGKAISKLTEIIPMNHSEFDLTQQNIFLEHIKSTSPERFINLAAFSGNLNFNQQYPNKTFENNVRIGLNVFGEWALWGKAKKAINVIPSCAYPDYPILTEDMLWKGSCNITIESHGLARRAIEAYCRQLNKTGARIATCVVNNSFGPEDSFDPVKTKVVGGLINKFTQAKEEGANHVICWGDGSPIREFIYSKDVAACLLQALDNYDDFNEPLNITSGYEITIKELAETIARLVGFNGDIYWDKTKPNGQMRKKLSTKKMEKFIYHNFTPIEPALAETIKWYNEHRHNS
jgi:GDP-L-fucose synthase